MPTIGPKFETREVVLTLAPNVTLDLVSVPAGEFLMGSTDADEYARGDEKPQHKVTLSDYLIGRYEVTNAQYGLFARTRRAGLLSGGKVNDPNWSMPSGKENHPVVQVSWDDALAFCAWASQVTGLNVKLPTEAQWEKAARGTDGRIFPWGNEALDKTRANVGTSGTTPVGSFSPGDSPYGLADMAGNVWQWTADWYSDTYYASSPASNPQGPTTGEFRVMRGGGWNYLFSARAAYRWVGPSGRLDRGGFRVVVASTPVS